MSHQGIILDVLVATKVPMSVELLMKKTGLHRDQVTNAASQLMMKGKVERIGKGIYEYCGSGHFLQPELSPTINSVPEAPEPKDISDDTEDDLNIVIDLLLPNGFKASHLGEILNLKNHMRDLVQRVTREN